MADPNYPDPKFPENKLPALKRFITTHDDAGKAIVSTAIPAEAVWQHLSLASFFQAYVTKGFPIDISKDADVDVYQSFMNSPPGLTVSSGAVVRFVDMPPDTLSPMHKTASLDLGVVLEGEIELVMDSGETRLMNRGDTCVQRATNHAWRNLNKTEWARMMFILLPATGETAAGEVKEDITEIEGLKGSD